MIKTNVVDGTKDDASHVAPTDQASLIGGKKALIDELKDGLRNLFNSS